MTESLQKCFAIICIVIATLNSDIVLEQAHLRIINQDC